MTPTPKIDVLLLSDHAMLREGLGRLIAETKDLRVRGEAADPAVALELARQERPQVAIVDVSGEALGVHEVVQRLTDLGVLVVALGVAADVTAARELLRSGARGVLLRTQGVADLLTSVRAAAAGEPQPSSPLLQQVLLSALSTPGATPAGELSARQRSVFELLGKGLSTREIAARLGLSGKTVESHRASLKKKLGAQTAAELLRLAYEARHRRR